MGGAWIPAQDGGASEQFVWSDVFILVPPPPVPRAMAIPRVFNSNTPFIIAAGGSELSFLGKEDDGHVGEEEKESLVQVIAPHLSRVMQHGTAKHVVTAGQEVTAENPCVSIVAQAESKTPCRSVTKPRSPPGGWLQHPASSMLADGTGTKLKH